MGLLCHATIAVENENSAVSGMTYNNTIGYPQVWEYRNIEVKEYQLVADTQTAIPSSIDSP